MTAKSIRFENVTKRFGEGCAVEHVSFTVAAGTLVTLLGPSGCGKTTTLRMIAGLEMASSGRILIGDQDVTNIPASERDVSMVFQSYALFPHMTVLENVGYGLNVQRLPKRDVRQRAEKALATVGLSGFGKRLPSELSGGQQQRVAVARALVLEPSVLLFDEPLSNLDARLRRQMREEIRDLQRRLQLTVVYVTHDQAEAMAVSDRIIVMNKAVIAQEGTPDELYETPVSPFVAGFMGDANQVRGVLQRTDAHHGRLILGTLNTIVSHRQLPDGEVMVAIRPEALTIHKTNGAAIDNGLVATVKKSAYLGGLMEYTLATSIGELFAVNTEVHRRFSPGDDVTVTLSSHGVVVIPQ
ncbi:MAG: ABC transporter ATP-binding protein [Gammaproteobacteria bacterium]|nr:ABC transporter ATP-binding protein [Gammaproteobacteria bacterium]